MISSEGPYSHLNHAGVNDAILQIEAKPGLAVRPDQGISQHHRRHGQHHQSQQPQQQEEGEELVPILPSATYQDGADPDNPYFYSEADHFTGHFRNWLPFRLAVRGRRGASRKQSLMGALGELMGRKRDGYPPGTEDDGGGGGLLSAQDEWMLDAARLVWQAEGTPQPSVSLGRLDDEMRHLPMPLTRLNKELVRTHLKLLSRFKSSVAGSPPHDSPFMKHWIPFIIQDPLLIQTVLFTSACFLNETGHLPKTIVVALRGLVYQALNQNLRSNKNQTTDAAILAVTEMVLDEWYWGATHELYAHLKGLKTMILLRGGLQDLGMHGFLSKLILIHDVSMALCHETEPEMYGVPGFEFQDPIMVPFQNSLNSPLAFNWPSFASCAGSLYLHPGTAMILDDMRTMYQAVVSLPDDASPEQMAQVMAVAQWVYTRLGELPDNVLPRAARPVPVTATGRSSSNSPSSSPPSNNNVCSNNSPPRDSSSQQTVTSPSKTETIDRGSPPSASEFPDPVYRMVRMTAVIYCRAVLGRVPTSAVCSDNEFIQIWLLAWRVPMAARRTLVGILTWVMLVIAPSCHSKAPARFVKTMAVNALMTVAVENWHLAIETADTALRLQRWLNGGVRGGGGGGGHAISGGEAIIDKYGFAQKEALKNISRIHLGEDDEGDEMENEEDMGQGGEDEDEFGYSYDKRGYVDEMDEEESYKEDLMAR